MPMSDEDLRELAEGATRGEWRAAEGDLEGKPPSEYLRTLLANREKDGTTTGRLFLVLAPNGIDPERGAEVIPATTGDGPQAEANAAYIAAASPDRILALLDEVDRLRKDEEERDDFVRLTVTHLAVLGRIDGGCGRTVVEALTGAALSAPTHTEDEGVGR